MGVDPQALESEAVFRARVGEASSGAMQPEQPLDDRAFVTLPRHHRAACMAAFMEVP